MSLSQDSYGSLWYEWLCCVCVLLLVRSIWKQHLEGCLKQKGRLLAYSLCCSVVILPQWLESNIMFSIHLTGHAIVPTIINLQPSIWPYV